MAENYSQIEKSISFFINQQFPAIYREDGPELVQLAKDYYTFMETQTNQSIYVSRRFYEYKDVDTTIKSLLIFYQKKYLADLELKESLIPFLVKNILDLYRRKGTKAGIELFFSIFYNEYDIDIVYPSSKMLKPSNSEWKTGAFLQMFPNDNQFLSKSNIAYTYADLISKNITGSISKAVASVTKINSILINGIYTPIIYIDNVQGKFTKYDDIFTSIAGEIVTFGRLNGSLSEFTVDPTGGPGSKKLPNNNPGDLFKVVSSTSGAGGEGIVVTTSAETDSIATYDIQDGGFGYTVANTSFIVSDQAIQRAISDQTVFTYGEVLRDTQGNEGFVVGTNARSIGVKRTSGSFSQTYAISTVDRSPNIDLKALGIQRDVSGTPIEPSPGILYPDGSPPDANTHVTAVLSNTQTVPLITDLIQPFLGIQVHLTDINAGVTGDANVSDYNSGATNMSGTTVAPNIYTVLTDAFNIQNVEIGTISGFANVNPGKGYNFDIFAKAKDDFITKFNKKNQIITLVNPIDVSLFELQETITESSTAATAVVIAKDTTAGSITVIPNTWYGFSGTNNVIRSNLDEYAIASASLDYNSTKIFGDNAIIDANVDYETGYIETVAINNSGFSYLDGDTGTLVDPDDSTRELAFGTITADTQGRNKGYWKDYTSHIDGYVVQPITAQTLILPTADFQLQALRTAVGVTTTPPDFTTWGQSIASDGFAYLDMNQSGGSITSADALQFAYLAGKTADAATVNRWNNIVVPSLQAQWWYSSYPNLYSFVQEVKYSSAGMRIQDSNFYQEYSYQIKSTLDKSRYEKLLKENVHLAGTKMFGDFIYKYENASTTKARFIRFFNDDGYGSALDIANTSLLEASVTNFTVDSSYVTADHVTGGSGGVSLNLNTDLDISKNWSQGLHNYDMTIKMPTTGSAPYPVAIVLHGNGGNGPATAAQFVSVLPGHIIVGVQGYGNSWNISNEASNGPDIEMLNELIDSLKTYQNVDTTKIRIIGISNGGGLTLRAAVEITDPAVDVCIDIISQVNSDQYRSGQFYKPSNEEQTGDAYANDGYDTLVSTLPQRKILQLNGRNDTVVPYNGGNFVGMTFLSAANSAYALGLAQGYSGSISSGTTYGTNSSLVDYGDVIFLNDAVGHSVSSDMEHLITRYLENNYDITTPPS